MNFFSVMGLIVYLIVAWLTFVNLVAKRGSALKSFFLAFLWPLSMIFLLIFMTGVFINTKRGR